VLEYPDALQFAGSVDGCILVVEAGRTSWHASARARDLLQGAGLPTLGVVLNKRRFPIPPIVYRRLP
jgi:Mrp family chromosome partitioning ATPase